LPPIPSPVRAPIPYYNPTVTPTRSIPTKSDPTTSPPVPARPTPTAPTKPSYNQYHGEGDSYEQKNASAATTSNAESSKLGMWIVILLIIACLVGLVAGIRMVRRRKKEEQDADSFDMDDEDSNAQYVAT